SLAHACAAEAIGCACCRRAVQPCRSSLTRVARLPADIVLDERRSLGPGCSCLPHLCLHRTSVSSALRPFHPAHHRWRRGCVPTRLRKPGHGWRAHAMEAGPGRSLLTKGKLAHSDLQTGGSLAAHRGGPRLPQLGETAHRVL